MIHPTTCRKCLRRLTKTEPVCYEMKECLRCCMEIPEVKHGQYCPSQMGPPWQCDCGPVTALEFQL